MPSKLKLTDRDIESLTKTTACGGVPGFSVLVRKLSDGTVSKFFILRMRKEKRVITLGKRILRTETAGLAILSVLMFHLEEE